LIEIKDLNNYNQPVFHFLSKVWFLFGQTVYVIRYLMDYI